MFYNNVFAVFLGIWLYITSGKAIQTHISMVGKFLIGLENIEAIFSSGYNMIVGG